MIKTSHELNPFMVCTEEQSIVLRIPQNGWMLEISQSLQRGNIPTDILCYHSDQNNPNAQFINVKIENQLKLYEFIQTREPMDLIDPTRGFLRLFWENEDYFTIEVNIANCQQFKLYVSKHWFQ